MWNRRPIVTEDSISEHLSKLPTLLHEAIVSKELDDSGVIDVVAAVLRKGQYGGLLHQWVAHPPRDGIVEVVVQPSRSVNNIHIQVALTNVPAEREPRYKNDNEV